VVAYEMLVGRPPFTGRSPTAVLHKQVYEPPPAPAALNPDLPPGLGPVLLEVLAKGRQERFQRAGAFAAELRRALLAESQAREREAQLAALYDRLQAAAAEEDWGELLALGGQIRALDASYRDVPELIERARAQMRRPSRRPVPAWGWWAAAGGAILAVLLGLGVALGPRLFGTGSGPTEALTLEPGITWTRPADGMVMVYVPGGTFQMGSDESDTGVHEDEFPRHSVTLGGFWIDQTEVTNAQYGQCVEAGACQAPTTCDWGEPTYRDASKQDHPVVCVDWFGAAAYCEWVGARLPTEAEWEYAARGLQGFIYPWGDDFECSRGNFDDETELDDYVVPGGEGCDGYERTAPVGSFPTGTSWCNAMDMAGNVWEWVADWYSGYPSEAQTNPVGPTAGGRKVVRGGGWLKDPENVRAANRDRYTPDHRSDDVGFRCVGQPGEVSTAAPTEAPTEPPTEEPTLEPGITGTRSADGMVMVHVPGGTFQMGSDASDTGAYEDEFPQHSVTLDEFWIDQTEVTNAQFAAFLNEQGNQTEGGATWLELESVDCLIEQIDGEYRSKSGYADHPVIEVSWYGAVAYCAWAEARLPTEAEWEYAARGLQGFIYPWGDDFECSRGNFDDETEIDDYVVPGGEGCDGYERTAPVGSFPGGASWCNALDMAGNVHEWVADWYGGYPSEAQTNPVGPTAGDRKVLRGGGWYYDQRYVRAANRKYYAPNGRYGHVGFRCVGQPGE